MNSVNDNFTTPQKVDTSMIPKAPYKGSLHVSTSRQDNSMSKNKIILKGSYKSIKDLTYFG